MNKRVLIYLKSHSQETGEGVWGCMSKGNKGAYRSKKCRVRRKQTACNNYYKGKQGQGLMETEGRFWPHHG